MPNFKMASHLKSGKEKEYDLISDPAIQEGYIKLGLSWKYFFRSYDDKGLVFHIYGDKWGFAPNDGLLKITKAIPRNFNFRSTQRKERLNKAFKTEERCFDYLNEYKNLLDKDLSIRHLKRSGSGLNIGDIIFYKSQKLKSFFPERKNIVMGVDVLGLSHKKDDISFSANKIKIGKRNLDVWQKKLWDQNITPVITYPDGTGYFDSWGFLCSDDESTEFSFLILDDEIIKDNAFITSYDGETRFRNGDLRKQDLDLISINIYDFYQAVNLILQK